MLSKSREIRSAKPSLIHRPSSHKTYIVYIYLAFGYQDVSFSKVMPSTSPPRSDELVFYPPRIWAWVLTIWLLILFLCFIFAEPPSIVWYYRQNLYTYLRTLCRSFVRSFVRSLVDPSILSWILGLCNDVPQLREFTLRFWGFAKMQLQSVKQTIRAWLIGKVVMVFFVIGIWWATDSIPSWQAR